MERVRKVAVVVPQFILLVVVSVAVQGYHILSPVIWIRKAYPCLNKGKRTYHWYLRDAAPEVQHYWRAPGPVRLLASDSDLYQYVYIIFIHHIRQLHHACVYPDVDSAVEIQ